MNDDQTERPNILAGYHPEADIAAALGVTARTLRAWRQQRSGPPHIKIGTSTLYSAEGFQRWLKTLEVAPLETTSTKAKHRLAG